MELINTYVIENKPLKELLDNIDKITTNIEKFKEKHEGYNYNIKVVNNAQDKDYFDAEINIMYEEQKSTKTV